MRHMHTTLALSLLVLAAAACSSDTPASFPRGTPEPASIEVLAAAAGCSAPEAHPPTSQEHVAEGDIAYDRLPPDGGEHRPNWAMTGVHTEPIEAGEQTHNLEHGHIGLQYDASVDPSIVTVLEGTAATQPAMIFAAPFQGFTNGAALSLTSWGHRVDCGASLAASAVQALVGAFVAEHIDQAPESVPGEPIA